MRSHAMGVVGWGDFGALGRDLGRVASARPKFGLTRLESRPVAFYGVAMSFRATSNAMGLC